ncbi:MAG TPA: DUF664 domain-containing protein [Ktedonobacteraceae bacterium]
MCSGIGSRKFQASGSAAELVERYDRWILAMQEALSILPDERLGESAQLDPRFHPSLDNEPMTIRDALLHAIEHCAIHQGHLELTRQLLGYAPAGAE